MKKALSMGAFTELDKQEIINMQGGTIFLLHGFAE